MPPCSGLIPTVNSTFGHDTASKPPILYHLRSRGIDLTSQPRIDLMALRTVQCKSGQKRNRSATASTDSPRPEKRQRNRRSETLDHPNRTSKRDRNSDDKVDNLPTPGQEATPSPATTTADAPSRPVRIRRRPPPPDANVDDRPLVKRVLKRSSYPRTSLRQLSDESFAAAEAIFSNKSSDQSAFRRLQCFNLQKLCSSHGIAVIATGIRGRKALKDDFVGAIMKFRHNAKNNGQSQASLIDVDRTRSAQAPSITEGSIRVDKAHRDSANRPEKKRRRCLKSQIYNVSSTVADSRDVQASEQMKVDNDETREIDIIIGDEYLAEISRADTPAASVDHGRVRELIMMEIESHRNVLRKVVQVRLYNLRTDYDSIDVLSMQLEENGDLNLITVARQFGSQRECRIVDPHNRRFLHLFSPGVAEAGDVSRFHDTDGFLRVVLS